MDGSVLKPTNIGANRSGQYHRLKRHPQAVRFSQDKTTPLPVDTFETSPVSPRFRLAIQRGLNTIPDTIQTALADAGYRVKAPHQIVELWPHLKDKKPFGYPKGYTWNNVRGVLKANNITIAESYDPGPGDTGKRVFTQDAGYVTRHEVGHAVDRYLGWVSQQPYFSKTYRQDLKHLDSERRLALRYFIQPWFRLSHSPSGKAEAFAEAFASINFPNLPPGALKTAFPSAFPNTLDTVQHLIEVGFKNTPSPHPWRWLTNHNPWF